MAHLRRAPVLFRIDGSTDRGYGHAMRCLALAEEFRRRGIDAWFGVTPAPGDPGTMLAEAGYRIVSVAGDNVDEAKSLSAEPGFDSQPQFSAIVLDHYGLGGAWIKAVRSLTKRVVVISDGLREPLRCDVLVDANLGASRDRYSGLVPDAARFLLGTRFCLLRSAFALAHDAASTRRPSQTVRSVLVSLGGGDQSVAVPSVVSAVRRALPGVQIHVVLGAGSEGLGAELGDVRIHRGLDDAGMAVLMLAADLSVGGGGTTSWERCAVGLPTVALRLATNQDDVVDSLSAAGVVVDGGRFADLDANDLSARISEASDEAARETMMRRGWQLVDGRGAIRVAHNIEGIRMRRARLADAELLWRWANDPVTRAMSFRPEAISYRSHLDWLGSTIQDASRLLLIGENSAGPIGQVRFDTREDAAEVSISVAPEHRGTAGSLLLESAIRRFRRIDARRPIVGRVKEGNLPSRRLFEGCGFNLGSEGGGVLVYRRSAPVAATTEVSRGTR